MPVAVGLVALAVVVPEMLVLRELALQIKDLTAVLDKLVLLTQLVLVVVVELVLLVQQVILLAMVVAGLQAALLAHLSHELVVVVVREALHLRGLVELVGAVMELVDLVEQVVLAL
jgi:hypothetical protein